MSDPLATPPSSSATGAPAPAEAPPAAAPLGLPPAARQLAQAFGLRPVEQQVLQALLASPRPLTVRQLRRRLGLDPAEVASLLPPAAPLRAHALVESDAAPLGPLRDSDVVHPARGLYALWHGLAQGAQDPLTTSLPGCRLLPPPPSGTSGSDALRAERAPSALVELVREQLVAHQPRLLWLSGCGGASLLALAGAARARLLRPALLLDARALAGWPVGRCAAALLRLRRDCDLRGAVLVVAEAALLGAALYALLGPRATGHSAPLVLASSGAMPAPPWLPEPAGDEVGLSLREVDLRPTLAPAAAPTGGPVAAPAEDALSSASREDARRRAVLDAARAMGKPLPPDFQRPAPAPPAEAAVAPSAATLSSATPVPAARPARRWEPAASAAPPAAPSPPASAEPAAAAEASAEPAASAAAPAASGATPVPFPQPAAASAAPPVPEPPAGPEPDPLPLSAEPTINEISQIARTTPNTAQRVAMLKELAGKKHQAAILALRQHLSSPHPAVRLAAEEGMTSIFGPDWNRARAIAPPVQPPRSDDGGRGPHGAF